MIEPSAICHFCHEAAEYKPLDEMESIGVRIFFCFTCNAEYSMVAQSASETYQSRWYSLYCYINQKLYRWHTSRFNRQNHDKNYLYSIATPGEPGIAANRGQKLIFALDAGDVDINPQNIESKIKTMLTFS